MNTDNPDLLTQTFLVAVQSAHHGEVAKNFQALIPRLVWAVEPQGKDGRHTLLQRVAGLANWREGHPKADSPADWPSLPEPFTPEQAEAAPWSTEVERWLAILVARGAQPFEGWMDPRIQGEERSAFHTAFTAGMEAWCGRMLQRPDAPQGLTLTQTFADDVHTLPLLHRAAKADRPALALALLDAGFPVDHRDTDGQTALMWATGPRTAEVLLTAGADLWAQDAIGNTPADHWGLRDPAERAGLMGVLEGLEAAPKQKLRRRTQQRALLQAAISADAKGVKALLNEGVDDPRAVSWACAGILGGHGSLSTDLRALVALAQARPAWLRDRAGIVWMALGLMRNPGPRAQGHRALIATLLPPPDPTAPPVVARWADDMAELPELPYRLAQRWVFRLHAGRIRTQDAGEPWALDKASSRELVSILNAVGTRCADVAELDKDIWNGLMVVGPDSEAAQSLSEGGAVALANSLLARLVATDPDRSEGHWVGWTGVIGQVAERLPGFLDKTSLKRIQEQLQGLEEKGGDSYPAFRWALETWALRSSVPDAPPARRGPRL